MDKNKNNKQGRSMFIYTALIFFVALILILLAFYGQNLSKIRQGAVTEPQNTVQTVPKSDAPAAETAEDINNLLIKSNALLAAGSREDCSALIAQIDEASLSEEQKILYNQIKNQLTEGKEQ